VVAVPAPLVGTFYIAPSPDADPFVRVGDAVEAGQTLGIVEAMKLMNPIVADAAGVVAEVRIGDAESVEYDQVLFLLHPPGGPR
jgi:acetyl-CoA carboxylase biotin carboxyl carrier protein